MTLLLTLMLSGCSTSREPVAESQLLIPPSVAMQKSKPLPTFDEEKITTYADVIRMDIETVRMYQELANSHDELVDWVNAEIVEKQKNVKR